MGEKIEEDIIEYPKIALEGETARTIEQKYEKMAKEYLEQIVFANSQKAKELGITRKDPLEINTLKIISTIKGNIISIAIRKDSIIRGKEAFSSLMIENINLQTKERPTNLELVSSHNLAARTVMDRIKEVLEENKENNNIYQIEDLIKKATLGEGNNGLENLKEWTLFNDANGSLYLYVENAYLELFKNKEKIA